MGRRLLRCVRLAFLAAILPTGFAISSAAFAEEAKPAIEEIIVTATKRAENVQDVPLAVTALTKELQQPTVRTLVDLNGYAPNVRIDRDPSRSGGASITIRGISPTRTDDNSFDSPIAVQIDGIYLGTLVRPDHRELRPRTRRDPAWTAGNAVRQEHHRRRIERDPHPTHRRVGRAREAGLSASGISRKSASSSIPRRGRTCSLPSSSIRASKVMDI